ncbi:MAG: hypothetical protein M3186_09935 [Actinomycetota bacterium]|nr:hypothetical protein [Actinomycetota bacterium]
MTAAGQGSLHRDLDILGKLAASHAGGVAGQQRAADALFDEYIDLMRTHALIRTDTNRQAQKYALNAASAGFFVTEQFLPDQLREMSLERKAAALADLVRLAFEPPDEPDLTYYARSLLKP